jgi:hypothetical protein
MTRWDLIKAERTQAAAHVYDFTLWPSLWERFNTRIKYLWSKKQFASSAVNEIPQKAGVYTFVIEPQIANHPSCAFLVYAGRAKDLRARFRQYIAVQEGRRRHSPLVEVGLSQHTNNNYLFFYYSSHKKSALKKFEQALIDGLVPPWNDKKTISSEVGNIVRAFKR